MRCYQQTVAGLQCKWHQLWTGGAVRTFAVDVRRQQHTVGACSHGKGGCQASELEAVDADYEAAPSARSLRHLLTAAMGGYPWSMVSVTAAWAVWRMQRSLHAIEAPVVHAVSLLRPVSIAMGALALCGLFAAQLFVWHLSVLCV